MNAGRVLIIEDEPALTRGLSDALGAQGFDVQIAHDGQSGLDAALNGNADLILLDVMLPKVNGYEICRAVRARGMDVPILMLTAKGQEEDVILGLNLGADDYITKPFRVGELIARVRAFLRRRGSDRAVCSFGDCEVNLRARTVRRSGKRARDDGEGVPAPGLFRIAAGMRPLARCHPRCGLGELGLRDAAQH